MGDRDSEAGGDSDLTSRRTALEKAPLFKLACPWPGRPTASRLVTAAAATTTNNAAAAAIDAAAVYRLGPFLAAGRPVGRQLLPFAGPVPNKKALILWILYY